jgi:hypothetical protein
MTRFASFLIVQLALAGLTFADLTIQVRGGPLPGPEAIQGMYEGTRMDAQGTHKLEARIVAISKDKFKVLIRETKPDGTLIKGELTAEAIADQNLLKIRGTFNNAEWLGRGTDAVLVSRGGPAPTDLKELHEQTFIEGTAGPDGKFELKRVTRQSPTLGAKPPIGAFVLLDGKNFDEVTCQPNKDGTPQKWTLTENGAIQIPKGGMNSKRLFSTSLKIHVEFYLPLMPAGEGQGRANSGCYLPNGDEIQVLDSFGMTTYTGGGCGGLYRYKDPDTFDEFSLASLPPLQWQTYDIEYRVQLQDGKPAGKPRVTVLHNGIKIHDNAELNNNAKPGGLHYQDHGNPAQYRNIWILPLADQ